MLRAGGSLTEVGQVLRHRGRDVTSIYAKVDRLALVQVVQPWPGSTGMTTLAEHASNYLTVRRALGFKLVGEGGCSPSSSRAPSGPGRHDHDRVRAAVGATAGERQPELSVAAAAGGAHFARYLHALDPAARSRRSSCCPAKKYRPAPYVYTDEEIAALMDGGRRAAARRCAQRRSGR